MIDIIATWTAVVGFGLASLHDIKTREVPDLLSYGLIALGVFYQFERAIIQGAVNEAAISILFGAGAFVFGYTMYRLKQWGGADTKLLVALGLLLGMNAGIPLFILFFINFLWVGAVYGLVTTLLIMILKRKTYVAQVKKDYQKYKRSIGLSLAVILSSVVFWIILRDIVFAGVLCFIGTLWLMSILLRSANVLMIKHITLDALTEGDWVIDKVKREKNILYDPKKSVAVTLKDIKTMKDAGITHVRIMEGVPFVPSFFIALLVTLVNPYATLFVLTQLVV